jgi:uncharacterized damage-inducible protein DinB
MKMGIALSNRFKEVMLNGTWVANTNFTLALSNSPLSLALYKLNESNSVGTLAQHIHYYIKGLLQVFEGGALTIKDIHSFDFATIRVQEQWDEFIALFFKDCVQFATYVAEMTNEKIESDFIRPEYGNYARNIEAMIEHAYYHLGQIVLLKKLWAQQA